LAPTSTHFFQIDIHALGSSSLNKSQKEVSKLFQQTIPEMALQGPTIVLLDEVETLAGDRQRMSLEANPIDVHRATDAALSGIDFLCRKSRNTLLIATTNFPKAVDRALLSRADWIEDIGVPNAEARHEIIEDAINQLAKKWPRVADLKSQMAAYVRASEGLDGRRLRKSIISAAASSVETAQDLNKLRVEHILNTLKLAAAQDAAREAAE
jgi:AAA+ superfamily predicted ATPase